MIMPEDKVLLTFNLDCYMAGVKAVIQSHLDHRINDFSSYVDSEIQRQIASINLEVSIQKKINSIITEAIHDYFRKGSKATVEIENKVHKILNDGFDKYMNGLKEDNVSGLK